MSDLPDISIIGPGRVGVSLAILFRKAGHRVVAIGGRDLKKCREAIDLIEETAVSCLPEDTEALEPYDAACRAGLVLLCVSDSAILPLCQELAGRGAFAHGAVVAHLSGALASDILIDAKQKCHCHIASAHPLQTFASVASAEKSLPGTYWFMEGDQEALSVLNLLVESIGGIPRSISAEKKALYHASSAVASNYLTSLIASAVEIMSGAGFDRDTALKSLAPLIRSATTSALELGPERPLTGPISRGDSHTVKVHLNALKDLDPELYQVYKSLGRYTVSLALSNGYIDNLKANEILAIFE